MATAHGVNQGKSAFLEEFLPGNRDASWEEAIKAWAAAGNEGTISESLFGKIRTKLGLTGRRGTNGGASGKDVVPVAKGKARSSSKGIERTSMAAKAESQPGNSGNGPGTNKTAFVEEALRRAPTANVAAVNRAWSAAGHEGTISDSVFYKVKRGRGGDDTPSPAATAEPSARSAARPCVGARPGYEGETGPDTIGGRSRTGDRERVLDRVEDEIDDLIGELKQLGGLEDALEALRKARRVVVRSHEG